MTSKSKLGTVILVGAILCSNYAWYNHTKDLEVKLESRSQAIEVLDTSIKRQSDYVMELKTDLQAKNEEILELQGKVQKAERISYRTMPVKITAYSQGDGLTPSSIMANGEQVYEGACALNGVPLNSHVRYNGRVYKVCDRVGSDGVLDIYMDSVQDCLDFGVKYDTIELLD